MTFDSFELEIALRTAREHDEPAAKKVALPAHSAVLHAAAQEESLVRGHQLKRDAGVDMSDVERFGRNGSSHEVGKKFA